MPVRTRLSPSLLANVHLHARTQQKHAAKTAVNSRLKMSRRSLIGVLDTLDSAIGKLTWNPGGTEWAGYYDETNYSAQAFEEKKRIVAEFLRHIQPDSVWDLGANSGTFSRLASSKGIFTVSIDVDPAAVEKNYLECVGAKETRIFPWSWT